MAAPRAQSVLTVECGPIPGQDTITAVPPFPAETFLFQERRTKWPLPPAGFPFKGKLPRTGGKFEFDPRVVTWDRETHA